MKKLSPIFLPIVLSCLLSSCASDQSNNQVVSRRYLHKYGYAVAKEDWEKHLYPGQIITHLRDGVTITATYEEGLLHGPCTHTYPHSQTIHYFYLYNQGNLVKELSYDQLGMPLQERLQLSPQHYCLTKWYQDGVPMSIENYVGEELLNGEYLTQLNELETRVEEGNGERIQRTPQGILLAKDQIEKGYMTKRETFYPSGMPESCATYSQNKLDGVKQVFAETGEPLAIEEWSQGNLHGKATYFVNGVKQSEIYYLNGEKNGPELHYIDGENLREEIFWTNNKRHRASKFYIDGAISQCDWYYNGQLVTKRKFDELNQLDQMITQAATEFHESAH